MKQRGLSAPMSVGQARGIERAIIVLCLAALVFVFQPFSLTLFGIGAGLVVLGGLAFNLVPLCQPGRPLRSVVKAGVIVLTILLVVIMLSIGVTELYVLYLRSA